MSEECEKYQKYLDLIEGELNKFFEDQKDYLHCKPGCSICCEWGDYPFSQLEMEYAISGFKTLNDDEKAVIASRINKLKVQKAFSINMHFMYECPFLVDKKCSIYEYRPIVCRTHGFMYSYKDKDGNVTNKCAECVKKGLNYSNVYDSEKEMISMQLWAESGIKNKPEIYDISRDTLLDNELTAKLGIDFGETKSLLDWF